MHPRVLTGDARYCVSPNPLKKIAIRTGGEGRPHPHTPSPGFPTQNTEDRIQNPESGYERMTGDPQPFVAVAGTRVEGVAVHPAHVCTIMPR